MHFICLEKFKYKLYDENVPFKMTYFIQNIKKLPFELAIRKIALSGE